jgi:2,3-bisphosphoglycerate-independent phosphoglycerate mutase
MNRKVLLMILDGFGKSDKIEGNAIKAAKTPNLDKFMVENCTSILRTSGKAVGLPEGVMGNSEVGHLNIGAGRIVYQMNTMIDKLISDGSFYKNKALLSLLEHNRQFGGKIHLFGLLSDGNVHSFDKHLWEILRFFKDNNVDEIYLHAFMDGRDTSPTSGLGFVRQFQKKAAEIGIGKIATISGRYYAMDRDNRWERVTKAYEAIVQGKGELFNDPVKAIESSYSQKITDEFIIPKVIVENDLPLAKVEDNDSILFFNFRADRARQLTEAFIYNEFTHFPVKRLHNLNYTSFSEYDINYRPYVNVCFRLPKLENILGNVISAAGKKQLRLAETEKYAHVTFFFNGGVEKPFEGEDRILVPSPKVATYDLQPQMSALEVKEKLVSAINSNKYDLIVTNFANCDMVGHTGIFKAAVEAVETVDSCVGEVIRTAKSRNYNVILTADHGNAEKMVDDEGNVFTAHTTNPVPVVIMLGDGGIIDIQEGILADLAPTILKIMQLEQPLEMNGKALY